MRDDAEARLARLAAGQHGVFTVRDAHQAGVTDRVIQGRVRRGTWIRLYPKVLCHASIPETAHRAVMAACLAIGGVASHESAGRLQLMHPVPVGPLVVSIDASRNHRLKGLLVHRSQDLRAPWITTIESIPVTTPARTLLDIGGVVPDWRLERLVDHSLDHRIATITELVDCFDALARRGRNGVGAMRPILAARGVGVVADTSELERMFTRLIRSVGLPEPDRQVDLGGERPIGRVDFFYRRFGLIVEVDGRLGHSQVLDFEKDRRRDQEALVAGLRVVRFTYRQVRDRSHEVIDVLSHLLQGVA